MIMRRFGFLLVAAAALAIGCRNGPDATRLELGGQAYLAQCAVCHGSGGEGNGPLASSIAAEGKTPPAPLDTTRAASLDRAGIRQVMESGAHLRRGSPMPLWGPHLGPEWMDRIADYVVAIPAAGEKGRAMVDRYLAAPPGTPPSGRRAYVIYCSGCHGPQGGGDGFFSSALEQRLKPPRLRGASFSTHDDAELSRLIGMGGAHAPDAATMPGWLYTISPDDRQALVGYLRTITGSTERK